MKSPALLLLLVALASVASSSLIRVDDDGSYSRVTVTIARQVPRQHCKAIMANLKNLLTSTSEDLFDLTNGRGRISEVILLLPETWQTSAATCLQEETSEEALAFSEHFPASDFVVSASHPIFGSESAWSEDRSEAECGTSGGRVALPYEALTHGNLTQAMNSTTFLHFCRTRFGVFPERGFPGDRLYPEFVSESGSEVGGDSENIGCSELLPTANGTSSEVFCPLDNYEHFSQTKQNLLCDGRSARQIILDSKDFTVRPAFNNNNKDAKSNFADKIRNLESFDLSTTTETPSVLDIDLSMNPFTAPTFKIAFPTAQRFVIVLDASSSVGDAQSYARLRNGLFRLFSHLPAGSEVAIVSFGAKARINLGPTVVSEANREGLFGKIPFRLLEEELGCVECGLEAASQLLDGAASSIILVSATSEATISNSVSNMISELALPVFSIALGGHVCADVTALTTFGGSFSLPSDFTASDLADAMLSIVNSNSAPERRIVKTFQQHFDATEETVRGNFVIDDSLNKNLWMLLTSQFKEDVEAFEVTSPSGRKHVFPKYRNGIVFFHLKGMAEPGIWSFVAKLYQVPSGKTVPLTVEVIAEATSGDRVQLNSWTSVANGEGVNAQEGPVMIYAKVQQSSMPVRDAKVVATVTRPGSSKITEIVLKDRGTGYPDLTKGDGIYSSYFVDFTSEPGLYSVTVRADHNEGEATIPKSSNGDITMGDCCGSSLADNLYTIPTKAFQLHQTLLSFKVDQGIEFVIQNGEPKPRDVFAPSRVTDFAVMSYVNQTLYASLIWTAPGGDFDHGKADHYEIRCYTNREALSEINFANMGIPVHESLLPQPTTSGTEQTATVGLPWANEVFYYGLVAIDAMGNRGSVSNLIPVYAAEVSTTTNATLLGNAIDGLSSSFDGALSSAVLDAFNNNPVVYITTGVICGLILILVLVASALIYRSRKRSNVMRRKENLQRTQIFVNDIEENNQSGDQLQPPPMPDLAPEKGDTYGAVWPISGSPTNSDEYLQQEYGLYKNIALGGHQPSVVSEQASWAFHQPGVPTLNTTATTTAPVHEFRSPFNSCASDDTVPAHVAHVATVAPTYQNWVLGNKPPSDNGTATTSTSSTDCSESSDQKFYNGQMEFSRGQMDPSALSLSPSFLSSERRRRQESLV